MERVIMKRAIKRKCVSLINDAKPSHKNQKLNLEDFYQGQTLKNAHNLSNAINQSNKSDILSKIDLLQMSVEGKSSLYHILYRCNDIPIKKLQNRALHHTIMNRKIQDRTYTSYSNEPLDLSDSDISDSDLSDTDTSDSDKSNSSTSDSSTSNSDRTDSDTSNESYDSATSNTDCLVSTESENNFPINVPLKSVSEWSVVPYNDTSSESLKFLRSQN